MATRECPFCAEAIQEEARRCPHCGERIDESRDSGPASVPARTYEKYRKQIHGLAGLDLLIAILCALPLLIAGGLGGGVDPFTGAVLVGMILLWGTLGVCLYLEQFWALVASLAFYSLYFLLMIVSVAGVWLTASFSGPDAAYDMGRAFGALLPLAIVLACIVQAVRALQLARELRGAPGR